MLHPKRLFIASALLFLAACDGPAPTMNARDQGAIESAVARMLLSFPDIEEELRVSLQAIGKDVWCRQAGPDLSAAGTSVSAQAFEIFQRRIDGLTAGEIISLANSIGRGAQEQSSCNPVQAAEEAPVAAS